MNLLNKPLLGILALSISVALKGCINPFLYFNGFELLLVAFIVSVIGGVIYIACHNIIKNDGKAQLLTVLIIVTLCYFDLIEAYTIKLLLTSPFPNLGRAAIAIALMALVFLGFVFLILKAEIWHIGIKGINLIMLTWLASCLIELTMLHGKPILMSKSSYWSDPRETLKVDSNVPNIYIIVMDAYSSNASLRKYWNYDNEEFNRYLLDNGFFIVDDALSCAIWSNASMCGFFNMNLSFLGGHPGAIDDGKLHPHAMHMLKNAEAIVRLRENNFKIYNYSPFHVSNKRPFYLYFGAVTPVEKALAYSVVGFCKKVITGTGIGIRRYDLVNKAIIDSIKLHAETNHNEKYLFYAHIMSPHSPYYFNRSGERINPPIFHHDRTMHLEQLIYLNQEIKKTVDSIIANNRKPIVVLMGDHGFRFLKGEVADKEEGQRCFFAIRLPGSDPSWFWEGMRPVDTFRLIFNKYFGANYPYLSKTNQTSTAETGHSTAADK